MKALTDVKAVCSRYSTHDARGWQRNMNNSLKFIHLKVCLHIPTPTPSPSPSKFNIVPMVTGSLTGRMGLEAILPVKLPVTIDTMLNFDEHSDGDGDGVGMCKQALNILEVNRKTGYLRSVFVTEELCF